MQAQWQPERVRAETRVGQDPADQEEGGEGSRDQQGIGELAERMSDGIEAGTPRNNDRCVFRRFQEVNDRKKGGGNEGGQESPAAAQQDSENQTAEQRFLD